MIDFVAENDGIRYLLVVINIFSKKLYVRPLKTKTMKEVTMSMESILKEIIHKIANIQSDNGSLLKNDVFKHCV